MYDIVSCLTLQKRKERESAILRNPNMTEEQRTKWLKVMSNEFMSSEESGNDSDVDIILHPIPWRSEYVSKMFAKIDAYNNRSKSSQA